MTEIEALRTELDELRFDQNERFKGLETIVQAVEPWVGPEGQLRVRLERTEQAFLALVEDVASNPASAAEKARAILTTITVPR